MILELPPVSLGQASLYWLKLGFISFGGPAGQIAIMHRDLDEKKNWISERRFLHALNFCMVPPGPEAQQLATYIGWLMHRTWGGIIAGALFVLPSFFLLISLTWIYLTYGDIPTSQGCFTASSPPSSPLSFCRLSHRFKDAEYSIAMADRCARVHRPDNLQITLSLHHPGRRVHQILRRLCNASWF